MVGRKAALLLVRGVERSKVERLLDQIRDEAGQVALGNPLLDRGRKEKKLVGVVGAEGLVGARGDVLFPPVLVYQALLHLEEAPLPLLPHLCHRDRCHR